MSAAQLRNRSKPDHKKKILVVEDDRTLRETLRYNLVAEGFEVLVASDGGEGLVRARQGNPDVIVLDLMLPSLSGVEVCKALRRDGSIVPVIMLTARDAEIDRVSGLESGADDYVTKPFSPRELVLRIKNLLRLTEKSPDGVKIIEAGPFRLDTVRHQATVDGQALNITATEFKLLCLLASRPGEVQPRETLLRDVWGYEPTLDTRTVDTTMQRLRAKLGQAAHHLETVRGVGYRLTDLNA